MCIPLAPAATPAAAPALVFRKRSRLSDIDGLLDESVLRSVWNRTKERSFLGRRFLRLHKKKLSNPEKLRGEGRTRLGPDAVSQALEGRVVGAVRRHRRNARIALLERLEVGPLADLALVERSPDPVIADCPVLGFARHAVLITLAPLGRVAR